MAATGAAAAEGVIAGATAAASGACMVLCDKLMTVGAGINAGLGGSSAPQAAVAGGAARAEQFAANWPSASMTGTIDELLGTEVTVVSTASGKTIEPECFRNPSGRCGQFGRILSSGEHSSGWYQPVCESIWQRDTRECSASRPGGYHDDRCSAGCEEGVDSFP